MLFIIDNNVLLDVIFKREKYREKIKILNDLIAKRIGYIPAASLHQLDYVVRRNIPLKVIALHRLIQKFQIVKTPSYVDFDHPMAKSDLEDCLIELSAKTIGAHIITSDKDFLKNSDLAVHPDDYFDFVRKQQRTIPFIDLKTQYQRLRSKIEERTDAVLRHGQYIMGPEVAELEGKLAAYTGAKHCITVASGTEALLISLMALGIGPGDEVITTSFTFVATAEVIVLLGATPVFVDIEPDTCNIDASKIEAAITDKTRAIIPVSLYGQPADMDEINAIASRHGNIPVIEDAAQSFGATYKGRKSCNLSTIGCTSFFPSKPLGCYGDGGAVFTNDDVIAQACREIRVHGQSKRYVHTRIGVGGRMDTLQCAVVLAKLERFDWEVERRLEIGAKYNALMDERGIPRVKQRSDRTSVFAQYTVMVEDRDELQKRLVKVGANSPLTPHPSPVSIPTAVHYPVPLHLQPVFADLGYSTGSSPVAEAEARRVMSLPMHPYLDEAEQSRIFDALREVLR